MEHKKEKNNAIKRYKNSKNMVMWNYVAKVKDFVLDSWGLARETPYRKLFS